MKALLDTSVIVAALIEDEPHHAACLRLLGGKGHCIHSHALAETFSTLTGGKLGLRLPASTAAELIEASVLPRVEVVSLTPREMFQVIAAAESLGVRGGGIYDLMHHAAARKAHAEKLFTLNVRHFTAFTQRGDAEIVMPR